MCSSSRSFRESLELWIALACLGWYFLWACFFTGRLHCLGMWGLGMAIFVFLAIIIAGLFSI